MSALPSPIGRIYSMDEAAGALRVSRRFLQDLVKDYPFYADKGGRKLFSEEDIRQLWEAMRCHSNSRPVLGVPTSTSAGLITKADPYSNLRALRTGRRQKAY